MLVTLTEQDLEALVARVVRRELQDAIPQDEPAGVAVGRKEIAKAIGATAKALAKMVATGGLGRALWKSGEVRNCKLYADIRKAKRRYNAYLCLAKCEREAWDALGADLAETEWKKRNY